MGAQLTKFSNVSSVMMEIRVFVPGARPDRFRQIIPIRPGESEEVNVQAFCYENSEEHPIFRFFVDGVDTGASIVPRDLVNYVKITCDCDEKGVMQFRGNKAMFTDSCVLKSCGFFLAKHCCCGKTAEI